MTNLEMTILLRQINEVSKQLQADGLAFLRMKLCGENVVLPYRRRKGVAISCARGDDRIVHRLRKKAVDEIHVTATGDVFEQWATRLRDVDLIPADLRNFKAGLFGEPANLSLENIEPGGATVELFAFFKQRLVAHADAQKGFTGLNKFFDSAEQILALHRIEAIVKRTDAGQHDRSSTRYFPGLTHDADIRANFDQGFFNAPQVTRIVIKKCNHAERIDLLMRDATGRRNQAALRRVGRNSRPLISRMSTI